jgi:uncharacterized small protein (DUF1192 family)
VVNALEKEIERNKALEKEVEKSKALGSTVEAILVRLEQAEKKLKSNDHLGVKIVELESKLHLLPGTHLQYKIKLVQAEITRLKYTVYNPLYHIILLRSDHEISTLLH